MEIMHGGKFQYNICMPRLFHGRRTIDHRQPVPHDTRAGLRAPSFNLQDATWSEKAQDDTAVVVGNAGLHVSCHRDIYICLGVGCVH